MMQKKHKSVYKYEYNEFLNNFNQYMSFWHSTHADFPLSKSHEYDYELFPGNVTHYPLHYHS